MEVKKKKKIIFTVTNDLTFDQRMARICASLFNAGFDIELVGRKRKTSHALIERSYKQTRLSCWFEKGFFFLCRIPIRLFFYLLFKQTDIYSSVDLDTILPNALASIIRSRKMVFDAHEYFTEVPELVHRKTVKWLWAFIGKIGVPQADLCYTVSQSLADIFISTYKTTFHVIRNVPLKNIPGSSTTQSAKQNLPIIIYQGDLNEGRGLEQTIDAMRSIDALLYIAGDGPLMKKLKQQVSQQLLSEKVIFKGYLNSTDLKMLTASATIGLNILDNKGLSYYYSLSNKFFNYIQAGVPQLCADFPEYRMINQKYEVAILIDLQKGNLASEIKNLLNNKELLKKLRKNCVRASEECNWEHEEQSLVKLYYDIG